LVERYVRNVEVGGSSPLTSTTATAGHGPARRNRSSDVSALTVYRRTSDGEYDSFSGEGNGSYVYSSARSGAVTELSTTHSVTYATDCGASTISTATRRK
jgi:hypothetical protein